MTTYAHENLLYMYDPSLRLWAVYPKSLDTEAEYFPDKATLKRLHPEFKFIKHIETPSGWNTAPIVHAPIKLTR